jgi:hypothetical protein
VSVPAGERRIPVGPLIGLVGGLVLLVSLFLDWWEGLTAFTVFEVLDLALAALALAAIAALAEALGARLPAGAPGAGVAPPLGVAALVIVVSQLLNDPPAIVGTGRGPALGLWLALGGSLLMLAGGVLAAARISLALDLERREPARRGRRTAAAAPDEPAAAAMRRRAAARAASGEASEAATETPAAPPPEPERPAEEGPERPGAGPPR